jgi:hypothetical protein
MSRTSKRPRKAGLIDHTGGPEGPSGRFWTQWIEPRNAALLSQTVPRSIFIVKNHGPESVRLVAHDGDLMMLPAGAVRATCAHGTVTVENKSEKRIQIEFEFLPVYLR